MSLPFTTHYLPLCWNLTCSSKLCINNFIFYFKIWIAAKSRDGPVTLWSVLIWSDRSDGHQSSNRFELIDQVIKIEGLGPISVLPYWWPNQNRLTFFPWPMFEIDTSLDKSRFFTFRSGPVQDYLKDKWVKFFPLQ